MATGTAPPGRFVGRDHELGVVADAVAAAARHQRQLLIVSGEAGIGKSRFCEQAGDGAAAVGHRVVWGRCWPDGGAPCLWPWQAILSDLVGRESTRLLADESDCDTSGCDAIEPERFNRFLAVADRLTEACLETPTMIVIDDVHHADAGSLLLTRFLVRALDRVPLVIVLTRRPPAPSAATAASRMLAELERDATTLTLHPFDLYETAAYLATRGYRDVDPAIVHTLLRVTGGSPLFLSRAVALGPPGAGTAGFDRAIGDAMTALTPSTRRLLAASALLGTSCHLDEVAAMTGASVSSVLDGLDAAVAAGLVEHERPDRLSFTHELVRQAALATLSPSEQLDAHARAAALLTGDARPARLVRHAHHALAASPRSDADADAAISACRAAARAMRRGYDYERAAELLAAAAELVEKVSPPFGRAAVLVEWAEAVLACGRFADTGDIFSRAVDAAEAAGDPVLNARAALAAGGFWLNQHRQEIDRQRVMSRQRLALEALPETEPGLRARLVVRLTAAEAVYHGAPVEPVLMALAEARRVGDPAVLADALSFTHHALLPPEHAEARLALAEELIGVASTAGEALLALLGLMWRTIDLYDAGDPAAERSLAELRERADALGCRSVLYIVATIDVMRLIRGGSLEEAEVAAAQAFELGTEVGDADAFAYYGAHLLTLRWLQGRDEELFRLVEEVATSPTLVPPEFTFRAMVAAIGARAGHLDRARALLDDLVAGGLGRLPKSSTWLSGMVGIVEAARVLGDAAVCGHAYRLLSPFAAMPVLPSFAVTCLGSVERTLGVAASTMGELDTAWPTSSAPSTPTGGSATGRSPPSPGPSWPRCWCRGTSRATSSGPSGSSTRRPPRRPRWACRCRLRRGPAGRPSSAAGGHRLRCGSTPTAGGGWSRRPTAGSCFPTWWACATSACSSSVRART